MKRFECYFNITKCVFFIIIFSFNYINAQSVNDTILASEYFKKADSLLVDRKSDSSITYFKKALSIYKNTKAWENVMSCFNKISENQALKSEHDKSLLSAETALEISNNKIKKENLEKANAYDNIGNYYKNKRSDLNRAIEIYTKALLIRKKILGENHFSLSNSYNNLGAVYEILGDYSLAIEYLEKSLSIKLKKFGENHNEISDSYYNIARLLFSKSEYDQAIIYTKKALKIKTKNLGENFPDKANYYNALGLLNHEKGNYHKAIEYINNAIKFQKEISGENNPRILIFYNNIGNSYNMNGEHQKALGFLKKAVNIGVNMMGETNLNVVMAYHNIAMTYNSRNDHDEALNYNNRALKIGEKILGKDHFRLVPAYQLNGVLYEKQKEFTKASEYLKKVLEISRKSLGDNHTTVANCYSSIGNMYFSKRDYDNAINNHKKALKIRLNTIGTKNSFVASTYNAIGDNYFSKGNYDEAIFNYQSAQNANKRGETEDLKEYFSPINLLYSLIGISKSYKEQYKENNKINHLHNSIKIYQKADTLVNYIRQNLNNYQDKVTFANNTQELYMGAIEAQILLYSRTENGDAIYPAFQYAEKSKANTLKGLLNDTNAKNFAGLPSNLVSLEKKLRIDHAFYQSQITKERSAQKIDSGSISNYENKLFNLSRRKDSLTEALEKNYPNYYQLKHQNEIISVNDIQQKLDNKTTFLEFFTADSTTYAFTISKSKIDVKKLTTLKLTENIEELRTSITDKNTASYKSNALELYQQLISPIKDQIVGDNLIISPDGPLWHLNFDLLLTKDDSSNNPKKLSYLLKDYTISYANSANLLFTPLLSSEKSNKLKECLAFSFSDSTNIVTSETLSMATLRDTGDDLPGTRKEIKAIANIIDGNYFYGSEAVEANFKKNASQYNILHLALHGEVDNERPENSKLFFTQNKDTIEDNLLYSHELFALDIPSELTVLSACNTGTGKIAKGEGIMSLGTAFQYAGTKSLLLSSWEVSDQTTPELMKYFYTNLKAGMNKAKALQQAKLQYLNTANINRTNPFYWGGFYLLGDTAPIQFSNNYSWYWVTGLAVFIILFLGIVWLKKRKVSF